jgi:hypothetical protein
MGRSRCLNEEPKPFICKEDPDASSPPSDAGTKYWNQFGSELPDIRPAYISPPSTRWFPSRSALVPTGYSVTEQVMVPSGDTVAAN